MKKSGMSIAPLPIHKPPQEHNPSIPFRQELLWLALILIAGLLPRLLFINAFPTHPISDFRNLLQFSVLFHHDLLAKNAGQWRLLSPGLPLILSILLRLIPASPEAIGRWATAIITGLAPVIPYTLWRGVFGLRTRLLAAFLLALWPGQILFSSVLAQDNWVILPVVGLTVLATRILVMAGDGSPVLAALFYGLAVAIREEMVVALFPVAAFVVLGTRAGKRLRNFLIASLIAAIFFAALVFQRGMATGRYTLFTGHLGRAILGAYIPGAGMSWVSPTPYLEAAHPELLQSHITENELNRAQLHLTLQEFLRRPRFQLTRIVGSTLTNLFEVDTGILYWSLTSEEVLPKEYQESAIAFTNALAPLLQIYPFFAQVLFAFSVFFAISRRRLLIWISPMLVPILLKVGLHAVVGSQPRYFLVVVALEFLAFAVVSEGCFKPEVRPVFFRSLVLGILSVSALYHISIKSRDYVQAHDEIPQLTYRFSLKTGAGAVNCMMEQGHLIDYVGNEAVFELLDPEPRPRESAIATCTINPDQSQSFRLQVNDPYPWGGLPDRIRQIVYVNGVEALRHDLAAESWAGWLEVPLGEISAGDSLSFTVEMRVVDPDRGWKWGRAASTRFRVEVVEN